MLQSTNPVSHYYNIVLFGVQCSKIGLGIFNVYLYYRISFIWCNLYFYTGQCKECKNFNSMFAIISGLGHGAVSRLRQSWEKLPTKYQRLFSDLQDLMDPSRNMSKYRQLVSNEQSQPPIVSFIFLYFENVLIKFIDIYVCFWIFFRYHFIQ